MRDLPYQLLADVVLMLHAAIVVAVVGGLLLILVGNLVGWRWVNAWWFRLTHLVTIAVVVLQSWLGVTCPLTSLEMTLRAKAQVNIYTGGFIEHWVQRLLYYEAPAWVFALVYTVFGVAVLATWWFLPPTRRDGRHEKR